MRIGEISYTRISRARLMRIKCVSIDGIKTEVILPDGMKPRELPNKMITEQQPVIEKMTKKKTKSGTSYTIWRTE